ncbi:hypothetical protein [Leuconostoc rapi]|uniref:hypothetical protein n=1 Tax=Leuconostoc rapi TaxID=1406906 RepID=UPI00195CFF13|nr:hypothetical protein [Leuconostoc rapi]MBM7434992.1 hypothetical protein [Leuconostoc rapi]
MGKKQAIYFELDVVNSRRIRDNTLLIKQVMAVTNYLNHLTKAQILMPFQWHHGDAISGAIQSSHIRPDVVHIYRELTSYLLIHAVELQFYMAIGVGDIDTNLTDTQDEALVNGSAVVLARHVVLPALKEIVEKQKNKTLGIQTYFKKAPILMRMADENGQVSEVEQILILVYEFELSTDKKRLIYSVLKDSQNWRNDLPKLVEIKNSGFTVTDTLKQIENRARMLITKADIQAVNNQLCVFEEK